MSVVRIQKENKFFENYKIDKFAVNLENIFKKIYTIITELSLKYIVSNEEIKIIKNLLCGNIMNKKSFYKLALKY